MKEICFKNEYEDLINKIIKCPQRRNKIGKKWKIEDYKYLIENYNRFPTSILSKKLNCSKIAIHHKVFKLRLKKNIEGKNNPMWRGNSIGYHGLHYRIKRKLIDPGKCNNCNQIKKLDLANISGKYKKELNDWEWLCRKCHMQKDGRLIKLHKNNLGR